MSNYHIIIATERRTDPARMANPIGRTVPTGKTIDGKPEYVAGPVQLHTHTAADMRRVVGEETLPPDFSAPQFVMVVEWDLKTPYVICHKGDYSARTMSYAGWPDVTKAQFDAAEVLEGRT